MSLKNISKVYSVGNSLIRAIDNISLDIDKGEFMAIIGKSGSGKSTLMNILGCLDIPSSGTYFLNSTPVFNMDENKLSKIRNMQISFIFQSFNLIPGLSSLENVALPLMYRKMNKSKRIKRATEALEIVGLKERINHHPCELSGGQQQRVAIARAIALDTPIILADEPTGNLDSACSKDIIRVLEELNLLGKTIILITHDDKIASKASRIVKIHDGRLISDSKN